MPKTCISSGFQSYFAFLGYVYKCMQHNNTGNTVLKSKPTIFRPFFTEKVLMGYQHLYDLVQPPICQSWEWSLVVKKRQQNREKFIFKEISPRLFKCINFIYAKTIASLQVLNNFFIILSVHHTPASRYWHTSQKYLSALMPLKIMEEWEDSRELRAISNGYYCSYIPCGVKGSNNDTNNHILLFQLPLTHIVLTA